MLWRSHGIVANPFAAQPTQIVKLPFVHDTLATTHCRLNAIS